jgi:nucleotide-binding universal stress UspA family protein
MRPIKTILCPTDFSDGSRQALAETVDLAKTLGADLCLLHVCPLLLYAIEPGAHPDAPGFESEVKTRLRAELEGLAEGVRKQGVKVETLLLDGSPGQVIVEAAQERGVDMVALATYGRTGLTRLTLGSVAERVVRHSGVPVQSIRGPH